MENTFIEKTLFIVLLLLFMVGKTHHILHMFQQNRYENERMLSWMKNNALKELLYSIPMIIVFVLMCILEMSNTARWVSICLYGVVCLLSIIQIIYVYKKKYIKPLVFTSRVIRQIVCLVILNIIWMAIVIYINPKIHITLMCIIAYFVNWIFIFVMNIIMTPIENAVKNKYLNDAKKILKSHSELMTIGITGSYGKTSTKNILQEVLSEKYYSLMTPASYNTPMGITRTIRELLKPVHEVFICEMGADHVGDIDYLCKFVEPKIGIVTSIGPQHLQTFKSQDNITNEKMKMIEDLPSNGVGIINYDNEFIRNYKIQNSCNIIKYGISSDDVDYKATNIVYGKEGTSFDVVSKDGTHHFETKLLGEHNVANILSAIAVAKALSISWDEVIAAVKRVRQVEHRMQIININGYTFIDDAFNSNPVGSSMALDVMAMMEHKRIIITPGMIDLGERQDELNKEFGKKMKDKVDVVALVGEKQTKAILEGLKEVSFNLDNVKVCKTINEAFTYVYSIATYDDIILLENDLPDAFNK